MPPAYPAGEELKATVQFVRYAVPAFQRPAPEPPDPAMLLPLMVALTRSSPPVLEMPPPTPLPPELVPAPAALPLTVRPLTFIVPLLEMPPPKPPCPAVPEPSPVRLFFTVTFVSTETVPKEVEPPAWMPPPLPPEPMPPVPPPVTLLLKTLL